MAGLRLPFPAIAREFLEYLQVAPSQILPNGWRYFFAAYIQWPIVLGEHRMSIREFFSIYRVQQYRDGTIAFQVRTNPLFLILPPSLTSNKEWRHGYFYVSGDWECSPHEALSDVRRIPRQWRAPSAEGMQISFFLSFFFFFFFYMIFTILFLLSALGIPHLSRDEVIRVNTMLAFSRDI
jgi:hypothetical protein